MMQVHIFVEIHLKHSWEDKALGISCNPIPSLNEGASWVHQLGD